MHVVGRPGCAAGGAGVTDDWKGWTAEDGEAGFDAVRSVAVQYEARIAEAIALLERIDVDDPEWVRAKAVWLFSVGVE